MNATQLQFTKIAFTLALFGVVGAAGSYAQSAPQSGRSILERFMAAQLAPTIAQPAPTPAQPAPTIAQPAPTLAQPAPTMAPPAQPVIDEGVSAPGSLPSPDAIVGQGPQGAVRKAPPIKYDTDRDARRMYASGSVNMIMVTENPADHCVYEIPLCIPACCIGEPTVTSRCGLFGRGIVEYCWPCGFEAIVKFRNIGDIRVDYEGD